MNCSKTFNHVWWSSVLYWQASSWPNVLLLFTWSPTTPLVHLPCSKIGCLRGCILMLGCTTRKAPLVIAALNIQPISWPNSMNQPLRMTMTYHLYTYVQYVHVYVCTSLLPGTLSPTELLGNQSVKKLHCYGCNRWLTCFIDSFGSTWT